MRQSTSILRKRRWRGKERSRWRKSVRDFLQSETPGFTDCVEGGGGGDEEVWRAQGSV